MFERFPKATVAAVRANPNTVIKIPKEFVVSKEERLFKPNFKSTINKRALNIRARRIAINPLTTRILY